MCISSGSPNDRCDGITSPECDLAREGFLLVEFVVPVLVL